jgi:hypothetical protein
MKNCGNLQQAFCTATLVCQKEKNVNRRLLSLGLSVVCWAALVASASAQHFKQISGALTQISTGGASVWGLNQADNIFQLQPKCPRIRTGSGYAHSDRCWRR